MEKETDEAKQPGEGGEDAASKETILSQTQDPSKNAQAEDTIRSFVADRLQDFIGEMESAVDTFEAYIYSQGEDDRTALMQGGFYDFMVERFEAEMFNVAGGAAPLMSAMVGEIHTTAAFAARSENDFSLFLNNAFRRGVRDASWFVRDSVAGLLDAQWPDILSLAADGNDQFIPALYELGLPSRAFKPTEFAQTLQGHADNYKISLGVQKQAVEEKSPEIDDAKKAEAEEQAKQDSMQDETKPKEAAAM